MAKWRLKFGAPTSGRTWAALVAVVVVSISVDLMAEHGAVIAALAVGAAAFVTAAGLLGRRPPGTDRQGIEFLLPLMLGLSIGRNAVLVPQDELMSLEWVEQLAVSSCVTLSLMAIMKRWLARCDRLRTAASPPR